MAWDDTTDAMKYALDVAPKQEPLKWKDTYWPSVVSSPWFSEGDWLPMDANAAWENVGIKVTNIVPHPEGSSVKLYKTPANATASATQAAQEYANQMMTTAMQDFYYQIYSLAPPGITDPYKFPLKLPAQPLVDKVESTFHVLDEKCRLMCTGKLSTYLKFGSPVRPRQQDRC
jgi:hypothetical protein